MSDLVERLRAPTGGTTKDRLLREEAADEIERLKEALRIKTEISDAETERLEAENQRLRDDWESAASMRDKLAMAAVAFREQRDEARALLAAAESA